MSVGVKTCSLTTSIVELARVFLGNEWDEIVVLDDGHAVGVVGQDELVAASVNPGFRSLKAEDIMRDKVPTVPPDIPLEAAAQIMLDQGVRTLFLTHHASGIEYPAASISYRHYLRLMAADDVEELNDLGIHAARQSPLETFLKRRDEARRRSGK